MMADGRFRGRRGKVLAVTFIYATCTDTCPLLTAKMADIQRRLGRDDTAERQTDEMRRPRAAGLQNGEQVIDQHVNRIGRRRR